MRRVNFKRGVLDRIAHRLGIDPNYVNNDHVAAWTSMVNDCVLAGFEYWQWPELEIAEERAFRAIWNSKRQFNAGDELFYIPTASYYKATGTPPVGTAPTNGTYFAATTIVNRFIAYDQPGKRPIDQAIGVYYGDPNTNCMFGVKFYPSQNGVQLNGYGGPTAFLKYRIKPPQFTSQPWDSATAYAKNDLVYFNDDGECYQAVTANKNQSPSAVPANWRRQDTPEFLAPYVAYRVAGEACDDAINANRWTSAAEDSLITKVNKLLEQGERHQYKIRRPYRYYGWPLGTSGFFWSVSPPWTSDVAVLTLTDQDDPYAEDTNTMLEDGLTMIQSGNAYVDVVFQSWTGGPAYSIDELLVQNFVDVPPLQIFPTTLVNQNASGFRCLLSGAPDNNNYYLKWRVVP